MVAVLGEKRGTGESLLASRVATFAKPSDTYLVLILFVM
jgi:hypothetical protein